MPEGPFYGYNREGAKPSEAVIANWWRQGMAGSAKAHYETVLTWLEDYTADLEAITVPVLVMHGEDDQIVPVKDSAKKSARLIKGSKEIYYPGAPHELTATHADRVNSDLLKFLQQEQQARKAA